MEADNDAYVPANLQNTYRMLQCAFPDGVEPDDYIPLLVLLRAGMNIRGTANVVSLFSGRDYASRYNDMLGVSATDVSDPADRATSTRLWL